MHQTNKFYLLLLLAVIAAGTIFSFQLIKTKKITTTPAAVPLLSSEYYDIAIENDDPILGNPGAPLTIVLFSDLTCQKCQTQYNKIQKFVDSHPQDVRLFLKTVPPKKLLFKTNDLPHRGAYCAGKQGKYWDFINVINTEKNISNESDLTTIAKDLNLNTLTWWQCTNSEEAKQKITRTASLASSLGIEQMPVIYINNKKIFLENDVDITEMLKKFIVK